MLATVPVPRVARCQMPTNAINSAIDTVAARNRSEEVIECGLSASRPGERRDLSPTMFVVAKSIGAVFYPQGRGVWVPAFAGTTAANAFAPYRSRRLPDLEAREIILRLGRIKGFAHHRERFVGRL